MRERWTASSGSKAAIGVTRRTAGHAIELLIVIAIIFILLGLAAGRYDMTIQRSREASSENMIAGDAGSDNNFTLDKQAAPPVSGHPATGGIFKRKFQWTDTRKPKIGIPAFDNLLRARSRSRTGCGRPRTRV